MRKERLNTTQRSWSNYVGDNPIDRYVGREPVGENRFYADSSVHGPGATGVEAAPKGYEKSWENGGLRKKRRTRLTDAYTNLKGAPVEKSYDPTSFAT